MPNTSSIYAQEGTAAHELANFCLENGHDAIELIGRKFKGGDEYFTVDEGMADAVQVYVDRCREFMKPEEGWVWYIERKFSLDYLNPPLPMFGTADFVAYNEFLGLLVIIDYKHGRGILVQVENNPQPKYYGLGALGTLPENVKIDLVQLEIVQPRCTRGKAVRTTYISCDELRDWSKELLQAAHDTQKPDAPFVAGSHCLFCKASGKCEAQARRGALSAQEEFASDETDVYVLSPSEYEELFGLYSGVFNEIEPKTQLITTPDEKTLTLRPLPDVISPPSTRVLTPEQIGRYLDQRGFVEDWFKSLEQAATAFIQQGIDIPNWKIGVTQGRSTFGDEDATVAKLKEFGLSEDVIYEKKLTSVARARNALASKIYTDAKAQKQKITKDVSQERAKELLADYLVPGKTGYQLMPASDIRPELLPGVQAQVEFLD